MGIWAAFLYDVLLFALHCVYVVLTAEMYVFFFFRLTFINYFFVES